MPSIDLAVLVCIVAGIAVMSVRTWRRGARRGRLAAAIAAAIYGVVLTVSMTAHNVDILSRWYIGERYDGTPLVYDFRLYSMFLLGAVLTVCGARLLQASAAIGSGDARGRSMAAWAAGCALTAVVPLIPIQSFFAVPLSVLGAGVMLLLLLAG
jgi:hypothetical protein